MATSTRTQTDSTGFPLLPGAAGGVVAFLVGYLITFIVKSGEVSEALGGGAGDFSGLGVSPPGDWQIIGWFFYQMHNVAIEISLTIAGQSQTETIPTNPETWLLAVPVVLLLAAGFVIAKNAGASTVEDGVKAGVTTTVGYFVLAILFAFLTTWSVSEGGGSISFGPNILRAALIAGVAYPAILGSLGGILASTTESGGR